jgi:alkane 1-monooxygenase
MKDAKYLIAYLVPLTVFAALYLHGGWVFSALMLAFVIIPLLELVLPMTAENLSADEEAVQSSRPYFDLLLYLNVPMYFGLVAWYFGQMSAYWAGNLTLENWELVGLTLSMGVFLGTIGINVAHELGHREKPYEQWMAKLLLLPNLYLHFYIEHNRGHHLHIATDEDPASARYNETVYAFFWRSVTEGYRSAWLLEAKRLARAGQSFWSLHNEMLVFQIVQVAYLLVVGWLFGAGTVLFAVAVAVVGFLMLELVNYIEHYGLRRQKLPSGHYERVQPWHSWNSNHEAGRIFLYELTRHSDHHFKATRKYQILRHFDESPQLPYGYPGCMLVALVPPLWFRLMNPRVEAWRTKYVTN